MVVPWEWLTIPETSVSCLQHLRAQIQAERSE